MTQQIIELAAINTSFQETIPLGRGRHSLDRSVWYNGFLLTFLTTGEETQGKYALIEAVGTKGNVPPPHIHHREVESFYVLEGDMTVTVDDRKIKATPGTLVVVPRGTVHSFVIDSEQLRVLILVTPAGMEGWFKEFSVPARALTLPPPMGEVPYSDVQRMLDVGPRFGIEFV
jgi:quercetin dioxygenase-like cupin family protein